MNEFELNIRVDQQRETIGRLQEQIEELEEEVARLQARKEFWKDEATCCRDDAEAARAEVARRGPKELDPHCERLLLENLPDLYANSDELARLDDLLGELEELPAYVFAGPGQITSRWLLQEELAAVINRWREALRVKEGAL